MIQFKKGKFFLFLGRYKGVVCMKTIKHLETEKNEGKDYTLVLAVTCLIGCIFLGLMQ